jgi:deazaflavin-dependent oxidoreductase (nitroreductase family)
VTTIAARPPAEEDHMTSADFENALNNTSEIELTTTGRSSGRESSRPVWFVRQRDSLYLLPVTGSDSQWYKNVLKTPDIRLAAGGAEYTAHAAPVTDPTKVEEVVDDFRAKYGADNVASYYSKRDVAVEVRAA